MYYEMEVIKFGNYVKKTSFFILDVLLATDHTI
jgi:hypothetical protein